MRKTSQNPLLRDQTPWRSGAKASPRRPVLTLSLFAGAGGLDHGFKRAGYVIVAAVELEESYCQSLRANAENPVGFQPTSIICSDIRKFDPTPYAKLGIECVIGGPPCQTFSAAGRRSGGVIGTGDERGQLFKSYSAILDVLHPKVFVFENVYGLPGANNGGPWRQIVAGFADLGYNLRAEVLDSADYGVPQHRDRLLMVGCRAGDFRFPLPTHGPDSPSGLPFVSTLDAIQELQDPDEAPHESLGGLYGHLLPLVPPGLNYAFFTREMGHPAPVFAWRSKFHDFLYKVNPDEPCRTIKAQPGKFTGPFHWKNRHFTQAELKRLQTFPDDYRLVGSYGRVVEQIGNSVPPLLAEVIAVSVREQLLDKVKDLTFPPRPPGFVSQFRRRQRDRTFRYKAVAARELGQTEPAQLGKLRRGGDERYFAAFRGFFTRSFSRRAIRDGDGGQMYRVESCHDESTLRLRIKRTNPELPGHTPLFGITIVGLRKYLDMIDSVEVATEDCTVDDLFAAWGITERELTARSRFFTLIDIYGHYANRGDTVKIRTRIEAQDGSPVDRALEVFGQSENCGFTLTESEACRLVRVQTGVLQTVIHAVRQLRYDLRTWRTHPTLESNQVLCTYPFPLLSGKAQLERRLTRPVSSLARLASLEQMSLLDGA